MEWWNPCGIHSIPYGIWVEWNHQNGWDITQNIFQVEWVESTWNDMDSIWIPCGMWGESKDLCHPLDSPVIVVVASSLVAIWLSIVFLPLRILRRARLTCPHPFGKGRGRLGCNLACEGAEGAHIPH